MPALNDNSGKMDDAEQVNEAVAFFEQILQSMPEDRVSLEVLSQAYEQSGQTAKACGLLSRLAPVLIRENDREAAKQLQQRLAEYPGKAEAESALKQLASFLSSTASPIVTKKFGKTVSSDEVASITSQAMQLITGPAERRAIVTQELDFAWLLHEQGLLSEDQYASIVSDITDLSTSATPIPISVLHLFQDRHLPNIDRALSFAAEKSGAPLLPLTSFEPQAVAYGLFPLDYLVIKGVVPFELMSNDLLVATLNPLNDKLREEMEKLTGHRCHFYLVQPADFDTTMDKIRALLQPPDLAKTK